MGQRCGVKNKKMAMKVAKRAFENGIKHSQTTGILHRYLSKVYFYNNRANNIRIYGTIVYVFRFERLITVLYVPNKIAVNMKQYIKSEDEPEESIETEEEIKDAEDLIGLDEFLN